MALPAPVAHIPVCSGGGVAGAFRSVGVTSLGVGGLSPFGCISGSFSCVSWLVAGGVVVTLRCGCGGELLLSSPFRFVRS